MTVKYSSTTGLMVVAGKGEDVYSQMKTRDRYIDALTRGFVINDIVYNDSEFVRGVDNIYLVGKDCTGLLAGLDNHIVICHDNEAGNSSASEYDVYEPFIGMEIYVAAVSGKGPSSGESVNTITPSFSKWVYQQVDYDFKWVPEIGNSVTIGGFVSSFSDMHDLASDAAANGYSAARLYIVKPDALNDAFYNYANYRNWLVFEELGGGDKLHFIKPNVGQVANLFVGGNLVSKYTCTGIKSAQSLNNNSLMWVDERTEQVVDKNSYDLSEADWTLNLLEDDPLVGSNIASFFKVELTHDLTVTVNRQTLPSTDNFRRLAAKEIYLMINPGEYSVDWDINNLRWANAGALPELSKNSWNFLKFTVLGNGLHSGNPNIDVFEVYGSLESKGHPAYFYSSLNDGNVSNLIFNLPTFPDADMNYDFDVSVLPMGDGSIDQITVFVKYTQLVTGDPVYKRLTSSAGEAWFVDDVPSYHLMNEFSGFYFITPIVVDSNIAALSPEPGGPLVNYSNDVGDSWTTKNIQQSGYNMSNLLFYFDNGAVGYVRQGSNTLDDPSKFYRITTVDIGTGYMDDSGNVEVFLPSGVDLPNYLPSQGSFSEVEDFVFLHYRNARNTKQYVLRFDKNTNEFVKLEFPEISDEVISGNILAVTDKFLLLSLTCRDSSYTEYAKLFVSKDGAYTWSDVTSNLGNQSFQYLYVDKDSINGSAYVVSAPNSNGMFIDKLFKSEDLTTWSEIPLPELGSNEYYNKRPCTTKAGVLLGTTKGRAVRLGYNNDPMWAFVNIVNNLTYDSVEGWISRSTGPLYNNVVSNTGGVVTGSQTVEDMIDTSNKPYGQHSVKFINEIAQGITFAPSSSTVYPVIPQQEVKPGYGIFTIEIDVCIEDAPSTYPTQSGEKKKYCLFSQRNTLGQYQDVYYDEDGKFGFYRPNAYVGKNATSTSEIDIKTTNSYVPGKWYRITLQTWPDTTSSGNYDVMLRVAEFPVDEDLPLIAGEAVRATLEFDPATDPATGWLDSDYEFEIGRSYLASTSNLNYAFKGNIKGYRITGSHSTTAGYPNTSLSQRYNDDKSFKIG